jgi:hypothetical protein
MRESPELGLGVWAAFVTTDSDDDNAVELS